MPENITKETDWVDILDSITWYNGLAEDIISWKDLPLTEYKYILCPHPMDPQLEIFWMMCVLQFGDYGTSPRSGWIEDIDGFKKFIDDITRTFVRNEEEDYA